MIFPSCALGEARIGSALKAPGEELSDWGSERVEQAGDGWQLRGSCRGPQAEAFFPPAHAERKDEKNQREARAKSICRSCPVQRACLDYALRINEPHGIWGGLNEVERKQLSDRRAG